MALKSTIIGFAHGMIGYLSNQGIFLSVFPRLLPCFPFLLCFNVAPKHIQIHYAYHNANLSPFEQRPMFQFRNQKFQYLPNLHQKGLFHEEAKTRYFTKGSLIGTKISLIPCLPSYFYSKRHFPDSSLTSLNPWLDRKTVIF